jgi:hypothetical protein
VSGRSEPLEKLFTPARALEINTMNLTEGQRAGVFYLRSLGHQPEHHLCAGVANIVYGHTTYHDSALRDARLYLSREGMKLTEEELATLVQVTRDGLGAR